MDSIAKFYGWVQPQTENKITGNCVECGEEIEHQAHSTLYECERCSNLREE